MATLTHLTAIPWKPLPYQKRAVKFLLEHGGAGLFLDPGLRKTSITLAALSILIKKGVASRALIVAPLRVAYGVWPDEIAKWAEFNHFRYAILHGSKREQEIRRDADIYLVNPESLGWALDRFSLFKPDTLVIDESTKFKASNSQRFKALKPKLGKFSRRWILTGTPAPNGLLDLFAQLYIVDEGHSLGKYITHYRNKYFDPTGFGGFDWQLKEGAEEQIYKAVAPYILRMKAEDYIDLPELIENDIYVTLPDDARKLYDDMEADAFAEWDGEQLSPANAAGAFSKCRQIANGAVYYAEGKWKAAHTAKLDALADLIEERGGKPVLVAYEFKHDYEHACQYFKNKKLPRIGGGTSTRESNNLVNMWNAGLLPVLWVHPASAGHGLNMQGNPLADCIVWITPPWDLELYDQLNRRIYRSGTLAKRVVVHRLVAKATLDLVSKAVLSAKNKSQQRLLAALKSYRRSR